jgi:hypothetical protein
LTGAIADAWGALGRAQREAVPGALVAALDHAGKVLEEWDLVVEE